MNPCSNRQRVHFFQSLIFHELNTNKVIDRHLMISFFIVLDGAPPHTAKESWQRLAANFGDRIISFKTDFVWSPYSPDLNPLDFFLWGHLKDMVYRECPQTIQELNDLIVDNIQRIDQDKALCRIVVGHFRMRLNVCRERGVRHLEHCKQCFF